MRADAGAIEDLVDQHMGDPGADLPLKVTLLAIEVQKHLAAGDVGSPAGVVFDIACQSDVALLQVGQVVIYDELYLLAHTCLQFPLHQGNLIQGIPGSGNRQLPAVQVKVDVKFIKFVIGPQEILVLNAVFPETHLGPVVKLGKCRGKAENQEHYHKCPGDPCTFFDFSLRKHSA